VNIDTNASNQQSDGDTDDLIEDAKNFVKAADIKLVDMEDWKDIDEKRRKRRLTRSERNKRRMNEEMASDGEDTTDMLSRKSCEPFLPRRISDLREGNLVRVISAAGGKVSPGVVRYIGYVEGEERVGVELHENMGDSDGICNGRFYFKCLPGYGQFVGLSRIVLAWRT